MKKRVIELDGGWDDLIGNTEPPEGFFSTAEIAAHFDIDSSTMGKRLESRARKKLVEKMKIGQKNYWRLIK